MLFGILHGGEKMCSENKQANSQNKILRSEVSKVNSGPSRILSLLLSR